MRTRNSGTVVHECHAGCVNSIVGPVYLLRIGFPGYTLVLKGWGNNVENSLSLCGVELRAAGLQVILPFRFPVAAGLEAIVELRPVAWAKSEPKPEMVVSRNEGTPTIGPEMLQSVSRNLETP